MFNSSASPDPNHFVEICVAYMLKSTQSDIWVFNPVRRSYSLRSKDCGPLDQLIADLELVDILACKI